MKKVLAWLLSAAMTCGGAVVPTAAAEDTSVEIGTTWKFDFGAADQAALDGYYSVTPTTEYNSNTVDGLQFGLYGGNVSDYKLKEYEDGVRTIQGQYINYTAEGSGESATDDRIGVDDLPDGQIDGLYPIRFSMAAEQNCFYQVKVTVTGLDSSKDATVNVYSERRHPIVTNKTITAGTTEDIEFTATIQKILVKNRTSGGTDTYDDKKLNVEVVGDNAAIAAIEVEKINPTTTIWCYDDSTGCDYAMRIPFFPLQNYAGTAQYLSKYLPENVALVNQGDGGLSASAKTYFNLNKANFKEGDYVYLQYGHNHKTDGPAGYVQYLNTYYTTAHNARAYMIFVGPIDRHNSSQYTASTNTWKSTLGGFSKAAKYYTELLIVGGTDLASEFASKAKEAGTTSISDDIYTWADEQIAGGITEAGVTDVAFVDLNQPTLDWLSEICDEVKTIKGASSYSSSYTDYYFQALSTSSKADGTHENDYGADATASFFFDGINDLVDKTDKTAIEEVEAAVLKPLVTNMREATWDHVSEDVITAGSVPNDKYPEIYVSDTAAELPLNIEDVVWSDDNTIESVSIKKQESKTTMDSYGMLELIISDSSGNVKGTITSTQVDNTWSDGTTTTFSLTDDTNKLTGDTDTAYDKSAGDTFTAIVYKALDEDGGLVFDTSSGSKVAYSPYYEETEVEAVLLPDEDGNDTEDFDYYGAKYDGTESISGHNGWTKYGSASSDTSLNVTDDGTYYANIECTTASTSFSVTRALSEEVEPSGRVKITMDLRNAGGNMRIGLANVYKTQFPSDTVYPVVIDTSGNICVMGDSTTTAGTLSDTSWTTVTIVIDADLGTVSVQAGENDAVTADVPMYKATDFSAVNMNGFCFNVASKATGGVQVANLQVLKLKSSDELPDYTVSVSSSNDNVGTAAIDGSAETSVSFTANSTATVSATATNSNYSFAGWADANDSTNTVISTENPYTFRVKSATSLKALFGGNASTIADYSLTADKQYVSITNDNKLTLSLTDVKDSDGVTVTNYGDDDIKYSCDTDGVSIATDGTVTISSDLELDSDGFKTITFTSVINGLTSIYSVKAHNKMYYDDFANSRASATWDGDYAEVASETGIIFGNGYSSAVTNTLTLPNPVELTGNKVTITFDNAYSGSTASQQRTITFADSDGNSVLNESLTYNSATLKVGSSGDSISNAVSKNSWTTITVTINDDGTGTVAVGDTSCAITLKDGAEDIAKIKLYSKAPARTLALTDIAIESEKVMETKYVSVTSSADDTATFDTIELDLTRDADSAEGTATYTSDTTFTIDPNASVYFEITNIPADTYTIKGVNIK